MATQDRHEHAEHHHGAATATARAGHDAQETRGGHEQHAGRAGHDSHAGHGNRSGHAGHGGHGGHGDHDKHAGHSPAMFRDKFWLSLLLTIPVVFYSHDLQHWFGYDAPTFTGSNLISPVLGTLIFIYGGAPFIKGAFAEVKSRQPGMMLLIGMAITVAFGASMTASLGWFSVDVWWELSLLIVIMLLGHWMEMRAIGQASGALAALAELLPDEAERMAADGSVALVRIGDLTIGDVVLVRPGARVPADGTIVSGSADLDESMITGESNPVTRGENDRVIAASVATDSAIRVRIDAAGDDTALAGIQRLVAQAQESSSRSQVLADRAAALLFYVAVAAAGITAAAWALLGDPDAAVVRAVTVLIIACPHALGLAIPLVISISTSKSARNGILVKDRLALERMRNVDVVLFDKTGTLTKGEHAVTGVAAAAGEEQVDALMATAAAVESDSEHPLARAIVAAARERGVDIPRASGFRSMSGRGVQADVDGEQVTVGGPTLLRERNLAVPDTLAASVETWQQRGAAVLHVVRGEAIIGSLALEDQIRPESRQAIDALHERGVTVAMITGDAQQVADAVATELGIETGAGTRGVAGGSQHREGGGGRLVFAEVLPEDKDSAVTDLQQRGHTVAMVGDGVNDAPALARADVGIAIGAGTDVAIESAGIVLASDDPRAVVAVQRLSAASYRKMVQNLWWAAGYNLAAIPLAAGALAGIGFILPMAVGAVLMSLSTVIVALNAQLLRRVDLSTPAVPVAQPA
ncbi:MAG: heavy metal translocating P-type ATPase [Actinophytocola sp.]|nr:heavy metal translocating P-type ATPase [Actinophytocola sp.]